MEHSIDRFIDGIFIYSWASYRNTKKSRHWNIKFVMRSNNYLIEYLDAIWASTQLLSTGNWPINIKNELHFHTAKEFLDFSLTMNFYHRLAKMKFILTDCRPKCRYRMLLESFMKMFLDHFECNVSRTSHFGSWCSSLDVSGICPFECSINIPSRNGTFGPEWILNGMFRERGGKTHLRATGRFWDCLPRYHVNRWSTSGGITTISVVSGQIYSIFSVAIIMNEFPAKKYRQSTVFAGFGTGRLIPVPQTQIASSGSAFQNLHGLLGQRLRYVYCVK